MAELCLVLHAHQPPVQNDWYAEALTGCYRPLLDLFRRTTPQISVSVSPTLIAHGFPPFADIAAVEWMTTSETHAILPLMRDDRARRRQIQRGRTVFQQATGLSPKGFWLPELAYAPGLAQLIADCGYTHMVVEREGGRHALTCHARDARLSERIWSRESGIPGHPLYRDFYDKRCRITDRKSQHKEPYDAAAAARQAQVDAEILAGEINARTGTIVAAFDAELFGHWWAEGPLFLEALFARVELVTLSDVAPPQTAEPAQASWGEGGDLRTWLQPKNAWMIPELHAAQAIHTENEVSLRGLAHAEASDWAYMLARGHYEQLATENFRKGLNQFYSGRPQYIH